MKRTRKNRGSSRSRSAVVGLSRGHEKEKNSETSPEIGEPGDRKQGDQSQTRLQFRRSKVGWAVSGLGREEEWS